MEPDIHSSLPTGSPIIAYGETRRPKGKKLLALIAGSFVVLLLGAFVWALFAWKIPFPTNIPILIAIHGQTSLPDSMPKIWQVAARASHPVLIGLFATDNGLHPFSLGLVTDERTGGPAIQSGPLLFQSEASLESTSTASIRGLLGPLLKLSSHQAWMTFEGYSGPIDYHSWYPNLTLAHSSTSFELPPGQISLNLISFPDAWPAIQDALARPPLALNLEQMPASIGMVLDERMPTRIELRFAEPPASSTRLTIAAAAGLYDLKKTDLPDGTRSNILELPLEELAATTNTSWDASTTIFTIGAATTSISISSTACGNGQSIGFFSSSTLSQFNSFAGIPLTFAQNGLLVILENEKLRICML